MPDQPANTTNDAALAEQLADQMVATLDAHQERRRSLSPRRANWASDMAHPCARYLTYARTHWDSRQLPDLELMYLFEEGTEQELLSRQKLESAGFSIIETQRSFFWEEFQISGKIDGLVERPDDRRIRLPWEHKTVSERIFDRATDIDSIKHHPDHHVRRIFTQMNLYLLMSGSEHGLLHLKTYRKRPRILAAHLDYDLGEQTLQMAKLVNQHVAAKTLPDRIPYDPAVCMRCDFNGLCLPTRNTDLTEVPGQIEVEAQRLLELEAPGGPVEEHKRLRAKLLGDNKKPGFFLGKQAAFADVIVSSKLINSTTYSVPPDVKAQYARAFSYWRTEIEKV